MGNLKIMTRACMPRHARACMFLTLSLYMIMQFLLICMYFSLPSIHGHVCLSVCLCMNIHVPVCTCVCVCARLCVCVRACMHACIHACMYVCMYVCNVYVRTYVCIGPVYGSCFLAVGPGPPSPDKNPGSAHGSARLSIHPSIHRKL